jgi:hypothetical protein
MISFRSPVLLLVLAMALILVAGCTTGSSQNSQSVNPSLIPISSTSQQSLFFYGKKIHQTDSINPDFIKMGSDIYLQGEVIEFHVVNEGTSPLACQWIPPYDLYRQMGTWEYLTKRTGNYDLPGDYWLGTGNSTPVQQLSSSDLIPGHYKIVKCGVSREFEIHAPPLATISPA